MQGSKRRLVLWILVGCGLLCSSLARAQETDPFAGNYILGNSAEIVVTHTRMPHFLSGTNFQVPDHLRQIFDVTGFGIPGQEDQIEAQQEITEAGSVGAERGNDVAVADFDGDDFDEIAMAWENDNFDLTLMLSGVGTSDLSWSQSPIRMDLTGALTAQTCGSLTKQRIRPGNFDSTPDAELLLAYWANDDTIRIRLYKVGEDLAINEIATINNTSLSPDDLDCDSPRFDATTGDFNGDGIDEVLLVRVIASDGPDGWSLVYDLYEVTRDEEEENFTLTHKASATSVYDETFWNDGLVIGRLAVATGDLTANNIDEAIIAFIVQDRDSPAYQNYYAFTIAEDLSAINAEDIVTADPPQGFLRGDTANGQSFTSQSAEIRDINRDGRGEIFVNMRNGVRVLEADDDLNLTRLTTVGRAPLQGTDHVRPFALADMNAESALGSEATGDDADESVNDDVWRIEIVTFTEIERQNDSDPDYNEIEIAIHEMRSIPGRVRSRQLTEFAFDRRTGRSDVRRRIALAVGDFDRDSVRLGRPRLSSRTDIVQPLVVLNAPPTHFDILPGSSCPNDVCDINTCYNGNTCDFVATHERLTEQTIDVTTTTNADWTQSVSLSAGLDISIKGLGFKAQERLEGTFGEQFSKTNRYTRTVSIQDRQTAIVDDFIYALVSDYDIWEYPVYANNQRQGWILAVVPRLSQNRWFDSKSFSALSHIPSHEVGNLLSYQSVSNPADNNTFVQGVRFETGDGRTLGGFSSSQWALTETVGQETSTQRTAEVSVEGTQNALQLADEVFGLEKGYLEDGGGVINGPITPSVSFAGNESSVEGSYSMSDMSLSSSSVRDQRGLIVDFGSIDLGLGNVRYTVTPYVYWARNGALVLDYGVEPEVAPIGQPDTFWDQFYGSSQTSPGVPDPAFILPWRYDPEKGFPLSEPAQRQQTKDITFIPGAPEPGDPVTIIARVHNWSLIPSDDPLRVRFYNGDPNNGGQLIVSPTGESTVVTTDKDGFPISLAGRGIGFARMDWTVPNDATSFYRIYAVIDEANTVTEVHENNNTGWSVLVPFGDPLPLSPLATSVLPTSRSATVGSPVTAFATMINTATETVFGCQLTPRTVVPGTFSYQTTDPATNALIGTPDTPVDIPAGGVQTFIFSITPSSAFAPANIQIGFSCQDQAEAIPVSGVNTLVLSADAAGVADIVALVSTPSNDGILNIDASGANAFAIATVNVGVEEVITVSADTGGADLPLIINVCATDPGTGACLGAGPEPSVTSTIAANATPTFAVFVTATGSVSLDAAAQRIFVRFRNADGTLRGSTSVAVTAQ